MSRRLGRSTWPLVAILVGYLAAGSAFALRYRHAVNPDATAYIDIARDYASGHRADAVNGLWSPLYSWVLVLPVRLGADPLLAGQLIQVATGALALVAIRALMTRLGVDAVAVLVTLAALAVVLVSWAVGGVGPDLLPVALVALYLRLLLDTADRPWPLALACGAVAGLGYLAKAAFLPFFAVLTVAVVLVRLHRGGGWRPPLVRAGAAVLGFAVLALPWALLISAKYQHLTFGTAGSYNLAIIGPGHDSVAVAHPQDTAGLLPPPNLRATSVWTDPTTMPLPAWNPLTPSGLEHELRNVALNVLGAGNSTLRFWLLGPFVLLWALWSSRPRAGGPALEEHRILTLAALVLAGIYLPWLVESRYLWPALTLLAVLAASWWTRWSHERDGGWSRPAALLAGALLLVAQPVHRLAGADASGGTESWQTAQVLSSMGVTGNLASDRPASWSDDLYLGYRLGAHYYGVVGPDDTDAERRRQLRQYSVDYFLLHGPAVPPYLDDFEPVGRVDSASVTVLRRVR